MSNRIIYNDFIGFTFNGRHSSEFGLLRVSDGDRYEDTLVPSLANETSSIPGGPGEYYWGEEIKPKEFEISVAYDGIGEIEKRQIKHWLHPDDKLHELIFDERPYVKYWVKCSKDVVASELCFNEDYVNEKGVAKVKRVYKGELKLSLIAPMPYGIAVSKNIEDFNPENKEAPYARPLEFDNFDEWKESSALTDLAGLNNFSGTSASIYNGGDVETGFELKFEIEPNRYELEYIGKVKQQNGAVVFSNEIKSYKDITTDLFVYINGARYDCNIEGLEFPYVNCHGGQTIITGQFVVDNGVSKFESLEDGLIYELLYNSTSIAYEFKIPSNFDYEQDAMVYAINASGGFYSSNFSKAIIVDKTAGTITLSFIDEPITTTILVPKSAEAKIIFKLDEVEKLTLSFLNLHITSPQDWSISQKSIFWGGHYKIDTNKKVVGYITKEEHGGTITGYEWKGVHNIVTDGTLFKLPSNAMDKIMNSKFIYPILELETIGVVIKNPSIQYEYLYI